MKPIVLVAIDAKFSHTNLAVRSIRAYAQNQGITNVHMAEFTINQRLDFILERLYRLDGAAYIFSCYIWNIEIVKELVPELSKIRPGAFLAAGGPEVSWHSQQFLEDHPAFHAVVSGEGEASTADLIRRLQGNRTLDGCPGLTWRCDGEVRHTPPGAPLPMNALPFPYTDLHALDNRVIYYESMRGCPFSCSFCLSSIEQGVRLRSASLVTAELQRFLDAGVKRVKFVDRTFNCNKGHAMTIWSFLQRQDNGVTNFHFELAAELLDEEMLAFLSGVRPGLFQFEIGVQSTNPKTLQEIRRPANLQRLFSIVDRLQEGGNIHLHLDLIAGLPYEDWSSFRDSFNQVYRHRPQQLQLGFLKVLKGSGMEQAAGEYGLVYRDRAPYEILSSRWMPYPQLARLHIVEEMVEIYYNSGRFATLTAYLAARFPSPFAFFEALADNYLHREYHIRPPAKLDLYEMLAGLMESHSIPITDRVMWLCRFDLASHEPVRRVPGWVRVEGVTPWQGAIRDWYNHPNIGRLLPEYSELTGKQLERQAYLEIFPFDPLSPEKESPVAYLFNYRNRDIAGHATRTQIPIEALETCRIP